MSEKLKLYKIKELFNEQYKYIIPIYQRNFAWSEGEIRQLILDIFDYSIDNSNKDYYIGTLIVYERENNFEIIDGQQRLTTLSILLSLIKNEDKYKKYITENYNLNLTFDSRKNSTETLQALYNKDENDIEKYISENQNSITEGYNICKKVLSEILNKGNEGSFFKYLFENVKILRVLVLEDTDLNHYFEIMNSRGEQLEMHEILKARLLEKLDDKNDKNSENNQFIFNLIWEACSNMEHYIQFGFEKKLRNKIFGEDLNSLINEEELYSIDYKDNNLNINKKEEKTIENILNPENKISDGENDKEYNEEQELFNSIINFPNFLLHVLKIQVGNKNEDIPLDDKRLLGTFNKFLKNETNNENEEEKIKNFVKSFGYNLLKIKFLFDKYIIKRELKSDSWSLKQLQLSEDKKSNYYKDSFSKNDIDEEDDKSINKKILMLLSMFHTSYPTLIYKNWLNDVLKYIYDNEKNIKAEDYKEKIKDLAKERYIEIINDNGEDILNGGTSVPHFIFNYLDYLLWEDGTYEKYLGDNNTFIGKINNFKFTFRSSVEHYYPQHPLSGKPLNKDILNKFGNLCLISGSKNSKLSNYSPDAKKEHYINKDIDSIKQAIMMSYKEWGDKEIEKHGEEMKKLLNSQ